MNGCKQNLMLTSNYFAKRFSDTPSAEDQAVPILDVAPKIFNLMLRYFKMG
jgi:BTB/POZ domain